MKNPRITIDQWLAFKAVVDEGSFAKAAEALHKSQSSISYAISKLEEQLPTAVLKINGRKAILTEEGQVLYRRASQLLTLAIDVEQTADCLAQGWEANITIAADSIVPMEPILNSISQFAEQAPQTRIVLLETMLSGSEEALLERRADIVLSAHTPPGFLGTPLPPISMVPVAHKNHPLTHIQRELSHQDLQQYRQIVVRDSGLRRQQDQGWLGAEQRLTVSHFGLSLQALKKGLGFAFVPYHLVEQWLANEQLIRLNLTMHAERIIPVYLTLAMPDSIGPAVKLMTDTLIKAFTSCKKTPSTH